MTSRRPSTCRFPLILGLGLAIVLGASGSNRVLAQLQTTDPYNPEGAMYRGSTYPGYVNDPSFYNRPVFRPNTSNQMDNFYKSLDAGGSSSDVFGDRYDEKFRNYADSIGRNAPLGNDADAKFFKDRQRRDQLYFQIQREKDPKRKAELTAEMNKISISLTRELSAKRAQGRTGGASGAPPSLTSRNRTAGAQGGSSRKLSLDDLPAFVSFRSPTREIESSTSLPLPLGSTPSDAASRRARPSAGPPPEATSGRSLDSVLDRALRSSDGRRSAPPPIPGLGGTPR